MRDLDFIIVGAPKCGTTSLVNYLNKNETIFIPSIKEPHFFGSDLTPSAFTNNVKKYSNLFKPAKKGQLIGEASTWYLFSKEAAREIYEKFPNCKIIIMLRNPIEASFSLHGQNIFGLNEDIKDFSLAVKACVDRRKGKKIPYTNFRKESLLYDEVFDYEKQLERYIKYFTKEKLHTIEFDEFCNNPKTTLEAVTKFLNIKPPKVVNLVASNKRKIPNSIILQKLIRSKFIRKIFKNLPPKFKNKVSSRLKKLNSKFVTIKMTDDEFSMMKKIYDFKKCNLSRMTNMTK